MNKLIFRNIPNTPSAISLMMHVANAARQYGMITYARSETSTVPDGYNISIIGQRAQGRATIQLTFPTEFADIAEIMKEDLSDATRYQTTINISDTDPISIAVAFSGSDDINDTMHKRISTAIGGALAFLGEYEKDQ